MERKEKINIDDLSVVDWLWDWYQSDPEFPEMSRAEIDALDIDNGGEFVVVYVGRSEDPAFALIYKNNGQVPYPEELLLPLEDDYFMEDGEWDDEAILQMLDQFATLTSVARVV